MLRRSPRLFAAIALAALAVAGVAGWWFTRTPDTSLRRYSAPRLEGAITIDGRLDDAGWSDVPATSAFVRSDGKAFAPLACHARIAWDAEALYVAFDVDDEDPTSPHHSHDADLWSHDVVEVFLDPGGDEKDYYELQVNPHGVAFDALFPTHRFDLSRSRRWNAVGLQVAAAPRSDGWTAELRLPFAAVQRAPRVPPQPGDQWRMNLFRIDFHPDAGGDYSAWTPPLRGDFHALDRFGTLVFGD